MEAILVILALAVVVWVVSAPLRRGERPEAADATRRDALEAAKDAKYREILDAELDFQTGKLSEPDYREVDRQLRLEAGALLRLEAAEPEERPR